MVGKWHLGGTADERGLPTRHGFDSYWGMPITNVQACRAGHREYPHPSLVFFIADRSPVNMILVAMGVVAATPWLFGLYWRWRLLGLAMALSVAGLIYGFTSTLTLLNPSACLLYEGERVVEQPVELGYLTHRHTLRAERYIASAPAPFFLYLSYANAHTALFAMDEHVGRSAHGAYGDNIEELDWSVGRVLDALDARGVRNDTLIYFASDNGPFREELEEGGVCGYAPVLAPGTPLIGPASATPPRAPLPLKGAKGQTWECGLRVPAALSYPARWAGGLAVHLPTTNMDVLPTVLALAGDAPTSGGGGASGGGGVFRHVSELEIGVPAGYGVLDGRSLLPLLDGHNAGAPPADVTQLAVHEAIFHYCGDRVSAVRLGQWKAHYTTTAWEDARQICRRNVICNCHGHEHDPPLLYDVHADPAESAPLDVNDAKEGASRRELLERIARAKARHEAGVLRVPSQTERLPNSPFSLPCCGVERGSAEHAWKLLTGQCGC